MTSPSSPGGPSPDAGGSWLGAAAAVVARPQLWPTAVRQVARLARPGWWRRRPFLPVPDPAYLAFRLETMYGGRVPRPVAGDVVGYLRWCRSHRKLLR